MAGGVMVLVLRCLGKVEQNESLCERSRSVLVQTGWSIFFFASRRRHTRFDCDWSSDVCSSDLRGRAPRRLPDRGDRGSRARRLRGDRARDGRRRELQQRVGRARQAGVGVPLPPDRKSTRLNSSHSQISYAVFCLKKKNNSCPSLDKIWPWTKNCVITRSIH